MKQGVRVPAILISPWVEKGGVIGEPNGPTETSQYEHSSVPATIKKVKHKLLISSIINNKLTLRSHCSFSICPIS